MKRIPLRNRAKEVVAYALVDDGDYEWLNQWRWTLMRPGRNVEYARSHLGGRTLLMHRAIMGLRAGDKRQVDHEDGNGLNNQRHNLRVVTHAQNQQNRTRPYSHRTRRNSSQYRGVTRRGERWRAYINIDYGQVHLGVYDTEEEAAAVAAAARREHLTYATT